MMTLAEKLRERAAAARRTAQISCGELGEVTVEALSLRDAELLLRSGDSARKIFYAACREVQLAGEEMRQRGEIATPDGILQFISDAEADATAQAVLALSGIALPVPSQANPADNAEDASVPGSGALPPLPEEAPLVAAYAASSERTNPDLESQTAAMPAEAENSRLSHAEPVLRITAERPASAVPEETGAASPAGSAPKGTPSGVPAVSLHEPQAIPPVPAQEPSPARGHAPQLRSEALHEGAGAEAGTGTFRSYPTDAARQNSESAMQADAVLTEKIARQLLAGLKRAAYVR